VHQLRSFPNFALSFRIACNVWLVHSNTPAESAAFRAFVKLEGVNVSHGFGVKLECSLTFCQNRS
jgi:hypothetical protein